MNEELQKKIDSIPEVEEQERQDIANTPEWDANVKQVYARSKTLRRVGGKLYGMFSDSLSEACDETKETSIQTSAILYSQYAGACDDDAGVDSFLLQ